MLKRSVLVAAAVCIVAMSVLGMSACVFDSDSNVILAKHHFTVEKYDLPEGVASLEVDSDYETDGKGSYVTNGEYIRFEMYLLSGYERGTLKLHISDDKYGERNLEFTAYESQRKPHPRQACLPHVLLRLRRLQRLPRRRSRQDRGMT